jgi:hypothetical protein
LASEPQATATHTAANKLSPTSRRVRVLIRF